MVRTKMNQVLASVLVVVLLSSFSLAAVPTFTLNSSKKVSGVHIFNNKNDKVINTGETLISPHLTNTYHANDTPQVFSLSIWFKEKSKYKKDAVLLSQSYAWSDDRCKYRAPISGNVEGNMYLVLKGSPKERQLDLFNGLLTMNVKQGEWNNLIITQSEDNIFAYLNGALVNSTESSILTGGYSTTVLGGERIVKKCPDIDKVKSSFIGKINGFDFYNQVLSEDEIQGLYESFH